MAKDKRTVFQTLDSIITGNWGDIQGTKHTNSYNLSNMDDKILYTTHDKDDYEKKKLELQQNSYLNDRWVKANVDLSVQAFAGLNNVKLMYRDADLMDSFPEIGAALDIVSEEATTLDPKGQVITVSSKSERIKAILEDLFVNRLDLQVTAQMIIRSMCKYGNHFMMLNVDHNNGVMGWKQLPVFNVERLENGIQNPYGGNGMVLPNSNTKDDLSTKFVWTDERSTQVPFRNWQMAHFRLISNSLLLPYGCLVGDTRIETEFGYKEMSNIQINDKVWTFNTQTQKKELGTVTMFMPKGEKDVYQVSTFHNYIEGTDDHKLLVCQDNNLVYKEIKDIKIGDLLIIDNSYNKCLENGFKTEKVREIKYVGKKQTYDFTVNNENSNFFANGIVTHNCSYLNAARRHWRMLSLMEDMMLLYRMERSIERRVFKIYVGAIDDADVQAYVQDIANNFKRTPIIDPVTGQIDLRKNIMDQSQDIFIPTRTENASNPIETLTAAQNLTAIDDIKYIQNKVCTALRIPKSFLNFEEAEGKGGNLALEDIRFTRTINRIQQAFLMELTKVASIHLYLLGFDDDLTNFSLSMTNPSTQAEQLQIDTLAKRIQAVQSAVVDPGNGIPIMSVQRALKEILKWSDKDIQDNFEEMRLENALANELKLTPQIIKRTGIFDTVDRIYGEPGAEYQENQGAAGQDPMGGGGAGGGMPPMGGASDGDFGEGLDDIGNEGVPDEGSINGAEGEMPIEDAARGQEPQPMQESKKILIKEDESNRNNVSVKRPNPINESILINEEYNSMMKSIDEFLKE